MRHRRRCAAKYAPGCISPLQSSLASQLPCRTHEGRHPPYYTHQPTIVELLGTCIQRPRGWQSRKCSSGTEKISSTSSDLGSRQFALGSDESTPCVTLTSGGMICLADWCGNSYLGVEVPHSPITHIYVTYDGDHATN